MKPGFIAAGFVFMLIATALVIVAGAGAQSPGPTYSTSTTSTTSGAVALSVAFTWTPASPQVGSPVQFTATVSGGNPGDSYLLNWQFGDGTTSTGYTPNHVFGNPGTYTVELDALDLQIAGTGSGTSIQSVAVAGSPPPPGGGCPFIPVSVTSSYTGGSLAGATVNLFGSQNYGPSVTGVGGQVTFSNVALGTYSLTVSRSGYFSVSQQVTITSSCAPIAVTMLNQGPGLSGFGAGLAPYSPMWFLVVGLYVLGIASLVFGFAAPSRGARK